MLLQGLSIPFQQEAKKHQAKTAMKKATRLKMAQILIW